MLCNGAGLFIPFCAFRTAERYGHKYEKIEDAFAAAQDGDTIVLLADATPALTSQRAITKAAVIDLGGKTLTLTEDDLYFGTTTFKNGTIVVDPSVKPSTAVFWMFANQTLTFDNVKIVATGVTGTYLIGLDGNNSDLNLLNGSEILVENTTALDLDIICVNASTGNDIVIENSKVNVTNLDGRVFFRGNYTVSGTSEIALEGITKAGFRIEAGQTLSIEGTATVNIAGEPRDGGIHLTDTTATYTEADTATVNATINRPAVAVASVNGVEYTDLQEAIKAAAPAGTVELLSDVTVDEWIMIAEKLTIGDGSIITLAINGMTINGNGHTITIKEIVSPEREDYLFYDAANLNINDLTIKYVGSDAYDGGIDLKSGTISNVTFIGGKYAVLPGNGGVTIENCTFEGTTSYAIYFEDAKPGIVVNNNTFNTASGAYAITMRDNEQFTNNTIVVGRVNLANSAKSTVTGNDFGTERFKVYNEATATITGNTINNLVFNDASVAKATFNNNTLSESAEAALDAVAFKAAEVNGVKYATIAEAIAAAQNGDTVTIFAGEFAPINISNKNITIQGTVGDNGELLTTIKGGNPAITGHGFNGTIKDLKIVDAFKVMYAEPAGNVTVDNVYVTGATYGLHLVAYSEGLTWTIQNSYMDLSWANSFGVYGSGDAAIVIKGNVFESTSPYYPDYGALHVNTFLPNVTVEGNVFGENAKIMIRDSVTDTSKINISKNYHADGVDNAFVEDSGVKTIYEYYADEAMTNLVKRYVQIGTEYYATLAEAVAAAQAGDEIVLLANATVEGTLAIPAGVTIKSNGYTVNGSIRMLGDLTLNGALTITGGLWVGKSGETMTATLSGDKLTATYFMFQRGNYTINADIDAVYGYLSYEGTFEVNSIIHTTGANGEVLYINGNVTLNDGAVLDSDNSVFLSNDNTVLTMKPGSKVDSNLNITASGAKLVIDATGLAVGEYTAITGAVTNNGTIAVVNNNKLEAKLVGGKIVLAVKPVASVGGVNYATLEEAFKAATEGCTIEILADVVIDGKWDCRDYATNGSHSQFKESVTINGNGHTIKFTGTISDNNWNTIFRFEENATVNNLTVDISEATGAQRVISAKKSLTVNGLTIIGSAKYGVIFGEGASAADLAAAEIVITDSTLTGTRRAISDNEGGKDVKSVTITDNTLKANVYASASDSIIFNNNVANGEVDLRSYAAENVLSVEAKDNTLTAGVKNYIYANTIDAQVEFTAQRPAFKVSTKDELNAALAAAQDGDTIILTADIDYGTDQLKVEKAITLDLGGKTLTTRNAWGGMSVKNNPTIKNGNIVHASNTAAIKVWNAVAFEDLVIDVQGKGDANKTIGGIVLQSGSTTRVGSIENVTIKGVALTNGIETYNCGDATENVIGSLQNVTIDANGTGMLISAPCGTATDCTISGGTNAIEIFIKGTYSASLELVDSEVVGGVYAHDEFSTNPDIVNNGSLDLTIDEETTIDNVTVELARIEETQIRGVVLEVVENAKAKVNNTYYATLDEAFAAANDGDTVTLLEDATRTSPITITKSLTIDGGNYTLTYTGTDRAIDVPYTANGANVTIKKLKVDAQNANRGLNYNTTGEFTVENVVVTIGANVDGYAINFPGYADGAKVTITNSALTSRTPLNIWGENMEINVVDSEITSVDNSSTYFYSAIQLNNDGYNYANGTVVTVTGGKLTALDEKGEPSFAVTNWSETGIVNISATTEVIGNVQEVVAWIGGVGFTSLQAAINSEYTGTIKILRDFAISKSVTVPASKNVTIDLNGKTIAGTDNSTGNFGLINLNPGADLTIIDSVGTGKITLTATNNRGWNGYSSVVSVQRAKLTVNGGTLEHLGGTDMAYAIDVLTNTGAEKAEAVINGGTIKSTYRAIRQFANSTKAENILTINGGTIEGANRSIWMQNANTSNNPAKLTVDASAVINGNVLVSGSNATAWTLGLSVESAALQGTSTVVGSKLPATMILEEANGVWGTVEAVATVNGAGYATLAEAVAAAKAGDTVYVFEGTYAVPAMKAGITIEGVGDVLFEGTLSGTLENLTLKNIHIKGASAQRWAYAKGNLVFENVTFEATSVYALHFDGITAGTNLTYKNCTIIGWAAMGGSPASCVFDGCTFKGNGNYGVIRTYFDATIKNCTFDVANVNTSDAYEDGIHAVEGADVTVENCTNVNGAMADIVNVHATSKVIVDGVVIKNVAKIGDTYYATLAEAFAAAQDGDEVVIFEGEYTENINVNKDVTVVGDGTTKVIINGKVSITADGATVKNMTIKNPDNKGDYDCAVSINAKNVLIQGCDISGYNGLRYCYTNGLVTFKDSKISSENFTIHFDGKDGGEIVIDNCEIIGWCSFADSIKKIAITNSKYEKGNSSGIRLYQTDITIDECIFGAGMKIDLVTKNAIVNVTSSGNAAILFNNDDVLNSIITVDGVKLAIVATATVKNATTGKYETIYFKTLQEAVDYNYPAGTRPYINLKQDIELDAPVIIPAGKTLAITGTNKNYKISYTSDKLGEAMIVNNGDVIFDACTVTYKYTGAADTAFSKGNYTIENRGMLTIDNATVENLSEQNTADEVNHMYCAIQQAGGTVTVIGSKSVVTTNNYRSIRVNKGDLIIKNGTFNGQIWLQPNQGDATITVTGGTFTPAGADASAIFMTNVGEGYTVTSAKISDGIFHGKIGCSDATKLAGVITGGKFNAAAVSGTNANLLATGYIFGEIENGYAGLVKGLSGSGAETDPYLIKTVEDLILFRDSVNAGETKYNAPGVYVALGADIDIASENWTPIGSPTAEHGFMGNFDGNGFKIKNLTITNPALDSDGYAYAGLFAVTEGTDKDNQNVIKNLTIENVTISTTGHIVSAAIAYPYYTTVENITVCGDIAIKGGDYTSGVLAYTRRCVNARNLVVEGNSGSYITGGQTIGGIISDIQMNGGLTANYSNFAVSGVTITGTKCVGGISGIIAKQTLDGATVKNVVLDCDDSRVGIVAGCLGGTSTISNVTAENVTGATVIVGGAYDGGAAVQAKIGDTYYATLEAALASEQTGVVELLVPITVQKGEELVIDLKGKTVSTVISAQLTKSYAMITNKGTLTITDSVDGGKLSLNYTAASFGYGVGLYTISNEGGTLNIEGGRIENLTTVSGSMYDAIDNNSTLGNTYLNISDGEVYCAYLGIRQFANSTTNENVVNVSGGKVEGGNSAIWVQNPGSAQPKANIVITNGNIVNRILTGESTAFDVAVSGGTFTVAVPEDYCAEGYMPKDNGDGTYGVQVKPVVEKFDIERTNMVMGENLAVLFAFNKANIAETDLSKYSANVCIEFKDKRGTVTSTVASTEWTSVKISGVEHWCITVSDLAAKEMDDDITVTIFKDNEAISNPKTMSLRQYGEERLAASSNDEFKTVVVDMLNYGAEAQKYFKYNTENLANRNIDAYQNLATDTVTLDKTREIVADTNGHFIASSVKFESDIVMMFAIDAASEAVSGKITFINHLNKQVVTTIDEYSDVKVNGKNAKMFEFTGMVVADIDQVITIEFFDENGAKVMELTDSLDAYLGRVSATSTMKALADAFAKFSTSAYTYLH